MEHNSYYFEYPSHRHSSYWYIHYTLLTDTLPTHAYTIPFSQTRFPLMHTLYPSHRHSSHSCIHYTLLTHAYTIPFSQTLFPRMHTLYLFHRSSWRLTWACVWVLSLPVQRGGRHGRACADACPDPSSPHPPPCRTERLCASSYQTGSHSNNTQADGWVDGWTDIF